MKSMYGKCLRGNELPQARLTPDIVREIRFRHRWKNQKIAELNAKYGVRALADELGVAVGTVEKVLSYQTWRHVL